MEFGGELLPILLEQRLDGPVLDRLERANLALTLDEQPQRNGLHAPGGDPLLHCFPEDGTRLVADQTIEHATRLLGVDFALIDFAGVGNRR